MENDHDAIPRQKTLWTHVRTVLARMRASRPASFYSAFAIVIVLLLGLQLGNLKDNPARYAFVVAMMCLFFFVIAVRAIFDVGELIRKHFAEHQKVFKTTLGDEEFAARLGERVAKRHRDE
jgi:uncharacterized membrane protein